MTHRIKLYGERNTNTNYMEKLIALNLKADQLPGTVPRHVLTLQRILPGDEFVRDIYFDLTYGSNLGWKHTQVKSVDELKAFRAFDDDLAIITITKNPYSWLLSLYRRPYHQYYMQQPSFEEFLQLPWRTVGRDGIKGPLRNPVELWNIKNASYVNLQELGALNLTTESIFEDPAAIIDRISEHFSIERHAESFIDFQRSTKDKSKDGNYYRDYYLKEKWREEFTDKLYEIINDTLDRSLMTYFGYEVVTG